MKKKLVLLGMLIPALPLFAQETAPAVAANAVNSGDTAWVLMSAALVLLMTVPALALFYGGLVRKKNILSVIAYSLSSALIVTVLWVIGQYSLIFGTTSADPASVRGLAEWFGTMKNAFLSGITPASVHPNAPTVPEFAFSMYQLMFAIITVALISGALVERLRFKAWFIFTFLWSIIVYTPLAHWVWNPEGVLWHMGALDFAGGLVVHTSSGVSALVAVLILGPRLGFRKTPVNPPANVGYVFIGAALLWVGWFGFNSGSALAANGLAASAFLVTHIAAAVAGLTWLILEWFVAKKPSVVGACTGAVAGLVAITPASGFVDVAGAFVIGIVVSLLSFTFMSVFRKKFKYDDALDVFSVHGIGGIWGAIAVGIFATPVVNVLGKGLVAGNAAQLGIQAVSVLMAVGIAVVGTLIALGVTKLLCGGKLRPSEEEEATGLDLSQHGEQIESE
jgi:ammonium transporter, Amt family